MPTIRPPDLPDFASPPVVEVAVSVQFEPLATLRTPDLARYWLADLQARFPGWEDVPLIPPAMELLGAPSPRWMVNFVVGETGRRALFQSEDGTGLIQIQQDRFVRNWRKTASAGVYPRYESIRESFAEEWGKFERFLAENALGRLLPNQCEVTYVNHISLPPGVDVGEIGAIVAPWSGQCSDDFLTKPEAVELSLHHVIREGEAPIGRLHILAVPVVGGVELGPLVSLTLTARGKPLDGSIQGALRFLDIGREQIVRGFASITTPRMHTVWERRDGRSTS